MKLKQSISDMTLIAMFTTLTVVLSQISLPLPFTPIPINLGMMAVFIAGGILGASKGAMSQVVYLLIGAIGIPVFANFKGGIGVLMGPTGGYIIGYIVASLLVGYFIHKMPKTVLFTMLALIIGLIACYMLGTVWFMFLTKNTLLQSLLLCVVPFLIGDFFKIIVSTFLILKLNLIYRKSKMRSAI